jgi:hypothetical protein
MHRHPDNPFRTLITVGLLFLAGYSLEIAADVWVVNHPAPNDPFAHYMPVPVTHIRHYVLPWGGFALAAFLLVRRAMPAGRDAIWTIEVGGTIGEAFGPAVRAFVWTVAAIAIFQTAAWLQCRLFGFFLPP